MIFCSTVIIENEQKNANLLRFYLKEYCPEIEITAISKTISDGIKIIQKEKPDIVFLDLDGNDGNGFSFLNSLENIDFEVIVTTCDREQVKKAFDYNTSHYLLKPFSPLELRKAVSKAIRNKTAKSKMSGQLNRSAMLEKTIVVSINNQKAALDTGEVVLIEGRQHGSIINLKSGEKIKSNETLRFYENKLFESNFYRVNRSYLINMDYVKTYVNSESFSHIEMVNGSIVKLPNNKLNDFKRLMQDFIKNL